MVTYKLFHLDYLALCRRQCDVAHEIHMGLMMDYVSEVRV